MAGRISGRLLLMFSFAFFAYFLGFLARLFFLCFIQFFDWTLFYVLFSICFLYARSCLSYVGSTLSW